MLIYTNFLRKPGWCVFYGFYDCFYDGFYDGLMMVSHWLLRLILDPLSESVPFSNCLGPPDLINNEKIEHKATVQHSDPAMSLV